MNLEFFQERQELVRQLWRSMWLIVLCSLLANCALKRTIVAPPPNLSWTKRAVTPAQLQQLTERNPNLTPTACMEILARLNHKDRLYIRRDIKKGRALKVPNDFVAYLGWTPLPSRLERAAAVPEFILVVKDIGFLGWYANGRLRGDSFICIGRRSKWTRAGLYRVLGKDIDHVSSSYNDAQGHPALMPFGLRIYGTVWIHGGDITRRTCSHGCINLPLDAAQKLYAWADPGTMVLIVESLQSLDRAIDRHSKLFALRNAPGASSTHRPVAN